MATDIAVAGGRIVAIGDVAAGAAPTEIDATGLTVLPGIIDSQVHFREPGAEHKEDLESGTRSAALGGVTSIFEMPNTNPLTITEEALADKFQRCRGRAHVDHAFFIGASPDNVDELHRLERLPGCAGVKIFMGSSTGSLLVADDATLARVLANGFRRISVHAEDEPRLVERKSMLRTGDSPTRHPEWRDVETALKATRRLVSLARTAGRRVHVLHITTAEEMAFLAESKDVATVEVTPQHLTLVAPGCYLEHGTHAQMNPPIRDAHHNDALWQAVANGVVDVMGSDHAPHALSEKAGPYPTTPSGMPGVQTMLPLMLDHVAAGRLTLDRLVDLLCHGPQRLFGIVRKGRIAVGYDADFALVDLKARREITLDWLASKTGWSPFAGRQVTGWPIMTILRGTVIARDGAIVSAPIGQPVAFQEALPPSS